MLHKLTMQHALSTPPSDLMAMAKLLFTQVLEDNYV
jgi:hypothetical protein